MRLTGAVPGRHVLTCNGLVVPLNRVGDQLVAGIRFRAWAPPSALHPSIGIHSPLVFEIVDAWSGMPLGGATYHVVHPGGRAYEVPPVNASEAEARRASRFTPGGHVDTVTVTPSPSPEYPVTLDLRTVITGTGAIHGKDT